MRSTPFTTTRRAERSDGGVATGGVEARADPAAPPEDFAGVDRLLDDDDSAADVDMLSADTAGDDVAVAGTVTLSREASCPALVSRWVLHATARATNAIMSS